MNWFQRYGIPGAYFFGLTFAWAYALYGCTIRTINLTAVIGSIAIIFLPVGYIISVLQQFMYLKSKRGVHRQAFDEAGIGCLACIDDEPTLEADSTLLVNTLRILDPQSHNSVQDWIRRRMDVITINSSLLWATGLAIITSFFVPLLYLDWALQFVLHRVLVIFGISALVFVLMLKSKKVLADQITTVIAGVYWAYKRGLINSAIPPVQIRQFSCVASSKSNIFHDYDCRQGKKISPKNVVLFRSREEGIQSGRRPCKSCRP